MKKKQIKRKRFEELSPAKSRRVIGRRSGSGWYVACYAWDYETERWQHVGAFTAHKETRVSALNNRRYISLPASGAARFLASEFLRTGKVSTQ